MRKTILLSTLILVACFCAAQDGIAPPGPSSVPASPQAGVQPAALLPDDPASFLGMGLAEALSRFGPPLRVEVSRGDETWQDDVVFVYASGVGLYWATDRLWQLRLDRAYAGSVYGIFIGDSEDKVVSVLGTPYYRDENDLVFRLPYRGYPVRFRVTLAAGKVSSLFVYRADF